MKHLIIPFIALLEHMPFHELQEVLPAQGAEAAVSEVNWPEDFPYCPSCTAYVARSETHLAILYKVRGLDLRAQALEDNGRSWEDSCCEFFVGDPSGRGYYNFELTCIGSLLACRHRTRQDMEYRSPEELSRILRYASLPRKAFDLSDEIHEWEVALVIPLDLIGVSPEAMPEKLRANFYKCGDKTAHPHFVSWNPVGTPAPDFHRPEFFGELILHP